MYKRWFVVIAVFLGLQISNLAIGKKDEKSWEPPWYMKKVSLGELIMASDIIVVGTVCDDRKQKRYRFKDDEYYEYYRIKNIEINKLIASVWTEERTNSHMITNGESRKIIIMTRVAETDPSPEGATLFAGGKFLLFLKQFNLPEEERDKLNFKNNVCYKIIAGRRGGAIFLSRPEDLTHYDLIKRVEGGDCNPYSKQKELLMNNFYGATPETFLQATETFAIAISSQKSLEQLRKSEKPLYSETAEHLLWENALSKFKYHIRKIGGK